MVASVTNNQVLTLYWNNGIRSCPNGLPPPDPNFDFNTAGTQIQFIQQMAARNNSWMQIVTTPTEARQAINGNKLAIVLGTELDSLSLPQIQNLVTNRGVRTVIPIHLADNAFGGSAVYADLFNTNTQYLNHGTSNPPSFNWAVGVLIWVKTYLANHTTTISVIWPMLGCILEPPMRTPEKADVALRVLDDIKAHASISETDALWLRYWVSAEEAMLPLDEIARLVLRRESKSNT